MRGYFVPFDKINELQQASIERLVRRAKGAHHTDAAVRINGVTEYHEADWIKHMLILPDVDDRVVVLMANAELAEKLRHAEKLIAHYQSLVPSRGSGAEQSKPA